MEERLAVILLLLLAASIIIVGGMKFYEEQVQVGEAADYVLEDLAQKHPNADIVDILDWETKVNDEGEEYLSIRARVTEGINTACPVRIHYFYSYPVQNFIADPPEYITTSSCGMCEGAGCSIAFEEEAIIASHTNSGAERVQKYVDGYADAIPSVEGRDGGWVVSWNSDSAKYGYVVEVKRNGEIGTIDTVYY
jgi:hypothetical protein